MKNVRFSIVFILVAFQFSMSAQNQEKKIKFSSGTLKICSSKNFNIKGYDGKEVIIKSLHSKKNIFHLYRQTGKVNGYSYYRNFSDKAQRIKLNPKFTTRKDTAIAPVAFSFDDGKRKEGLKKLGKKQENVDLGIYFTIEEKNGELIFKDNYDERFLTMHSDESYEIMIPNSIKLNWDTNGCRDRSERRGNVWFYNSKASSLTDFKGEVEISTSLNNMKLKDLTGPVSINSIGGNVTIEFDKKKPMKLYSIYSNNGFIDITLPSDSDVQIDAKGSSIYSDLDFIVLNEKEENGMQEMKLKYRNGRTKMKLDAGFGNIYLRKK